MGRARKQKHGGPLSDGKGRSGSAASADMIPRQAVSAQKRHESKKGK